MKRVNLSASMIGPGANLELQVLVFLRSGTVKFGNETFAVQNGTMKFNIKVSWYAGACLSNIGRRSAMSGVGKQFARGKREKRKLLARYHLGDPLG